jgi:hypothetical protein
LRALGQGVDLHARVVVIELAVHAPALGGEQVADGVAHGGLAAMAHVQRAGGVGGDELDQHLLAARGWQPNFAAPAPRTTSCLAAGLRRMFRKPGPAISMASTQRWKAAWPARP